MPVGLPLQAVIQGNDVQHVQVLALVFVQALDLDIKQGRRVDLDAGALTGCRAARSSCSRASPRCQSWWKSGSSASCSSSPQLVEVFDPAVADLLVMRGQARIGQQQQAPGRDAVGFVAELLRRIHRNPAAHCFNSSVWRAATPLMAWLPTQARFAMRTYLSPLSSISESRSTRSSSPGNCSALRRGSGD